MAADVKDEKEVLYFPGVDEGEWCEKIFYKQDEIASVKTEDFYKVDPKLPYRFKYPYALNTYGCQGEPEKIDIHYRTTSSEYGYYRPTVHTVSTKYFPKDSSFTKFMVGRRSRSTRLNA